MKIAAPHLANLLAFTSTLGYQEETLKERFLVDKTLNLQLVENKVSVSEFTAIVASVLDTTGDDFFGLRYGCFMNIKALGLIYELSKSASSPEQVLAFLKGFLENTFPVFSVDVHKQKAKTKILLSCALADPVVKRHLLDASLCILYRELKLIVEDGCVVGAVFPHPNLDKYHHMLGPDVAAGNQHALEFDSAKLGVSLNAQNIATLAELLPPFLLLLEQAKGYDGFAAQVKKMLLHMSRPELPDLGQLAEQFCMSPRSFQRHLAAAGTSYRKMVDEVKKELAVYLKMSRGLKTQEIAFLLGYAEASAYLHAAKKWRLPTTGPIAK